MDFHKNWQNFLEGKRFDEATAAKKRGIELPSMSAQLRKYAVADNQIPTHYIF